MYPRRLILKNNSLAHVTFRCHDRKYFLEPAEIKNKLILLWAKYKRRYGIKIFDFIIMDNHAHLILRASSVEELGAFMRTVNSQLARIINSYFERDSQALRDRYKSPLITSQRYLKTAIQYVWLNRYKVNRSAPPENDRFCSVFWRLRRPYRYIAEPKSENEMIRNLLATLLDSYEKEDLTTRDNELDLVKSWLSEAKNMLLEIFQMPWGNAHTIGDSPDVKFRGELLSAFRRRSRPPW